MPNQQLSLHEAIDGEVQIVERMLPQKLGPQPHRAACSAANMNYDVYAIHCLS